MWIGVVTVGRYPVDPVLNPQRLPFSEATLVDESSFEKQQLFDTLLFEEFLNAAHLTAASSVISER
jgi:hypothetical protein